MLRDFRYAVRRLLKTPWFTAASVLILAFAIGSNLAVFGLIDALMLRSIPVARPEELVRIDPVGPGGKLNGMPSTVLDALRQETVFRGACGFTTPRTTTRINGIVASTGTLSMSGDCFDTLGVTTQIGRPLGMADDRADAPDVVVLTARLWRSAFGGSPDVLGKQIQAGAQTYTVVGVATDRFTGVLLGFEPGLILPLHHMPTDGSARRYTYFWVTVFTRLAPGISQAAASARIAAITPALLEQTVPFRYNQAQRRNYLANHLVLASARTGVDWMLRGRFGGPLFALLGICAAILLIACLNLAGLLSARMLARQKEVAVRLAIGGSRWRVTRPLALESLLLALAGTAVGVLFARWANSVMVAAASAMFANFSIDDSFNGHAFALVAGIVVCVAVALTVIPVRQSRLRGGVPNVRDAGRGVVASAGRAQKVLIGMQVAFTLALVAAGAVFASSFASLHALPLGLQTEGVAESMLSPLPGGYTQDNQAPYYASLRQRIAALPGVQSASLSSFAMYWQKLYPELVRAADGGREMRAQTIRISEGYFSTIGARLESGEDFAPGRIAPEAIVSESVARLLGGDVLGRQILIGDNDSAKSYRVIGVAPTIRLSMEDSREPSPLAVYLNFWEEPRQQRYPVMFVKGAHGRLPDSRALAQTVESCGREYVEEYRALEFQRDEAIVEDRLLAWLSSAFGVLALALAAIGLFAILSCYVAARTAEIGVRMALGAGAAQIRALVLRQIGPVMLIGTVAGLGLAFAASRALSVITIGVGGREPWLLGVAVASLLLTALAAAVIPARRAASIPPVEALRQE